mgnify:CR=1 FL=1
MDNEKKKRILYFENKKKEKNFPKNPNNISGEELKEHFDLNNDGKVTIKEYAEHIKFHCNNPETLDREIRKSFEKGGELEDLFYNYEKLPSKPKRIINYYMQKYEDGNYDYQDSKEFLEKMEKEGYTFDYGLDNEPYDLRKMEKGVRTPNIEYKNGGALSKEFKFDKNFVIYVPSTSNVGDKISQKELSRRVNEVEKFVANEFGGYTETETDGGYKSQSGEIVEEDIIKVSVFANNKDWKENENKVVSKVKKWAKDWGQEAIGFEYEGDLYYIDDEGKFAKGGLVHAYDDDGSLYGTGTIEKVKGKKTLVRFDGSTVKEFDSDKVKPVMMRGGLTKSELKEKQELRKVVSKSFNWYRYRKGKTWTGSDTNKLAEEISFNLKSFQEFPQVSSKDLREFVDEMEGYSVPKDKGINYVTESLYSYFMKGAGYEKGGLTPKKAKKILKDGTAQGKPLTDKQKRYFGYVASQEDEISERVRRKRMERGGKITLQDYLDKRQKDNPKPKTYVETFIDEDTGEEVKVERTSNLDDFLIKDSPSKKKRERKVEKKQRKIFYQTLALRDEIMYLEEELSDLENEISQKFRDMEQTAEPEGGKIADDFSVDIEKLERRKLAVKKVLTQKKKDLSRLETKEVDVSDDFYDRYGEFV